jgi:hypothetical protein
MPVHNQCVLERNRWCRSIPNLLALFAFEKNRNAYVNAHLLKYWMRGFQHKELPNPGRQLFMHNRIQYER